MVDSERLLSDGKDAPAECLCLPVFSLGVKDTGKILETEGYVGMVRPQGSLAYVEGAAVERFGLDEAASGLIEHSQIAEGGGRIEIVRNR